MRLPLPATIPTDFVLRWRSTAYLVALALILIGLTLPGRALASDADVQTSWRLLD